MLAVFLALVLLLACLLSMGNGSENDPSPRPPQSTRNLRREAASPPSSNVMSAVRHGDGSWSRAYREATGEDREALELLLKCHIVSVHEFAESRVGQKHIDECIWIAATMLRQRPLEDWAANRHNAQQIFEESAMQCFASRVEDAVDARRKPPQSDPAPPVKQPLTEPVTLPPMSFSGSPGGTPTGSGKLGTPSGSGHFPRPGHPSTTPPPGGTVSGGSMGRPGGHSSRMVIPPLDSRRMADARHRQDDDEDDPYTTRSWDRGDASRSPPRRAPPSSQW